MADHLTVLRLEMLAQAAHLGGAVVALGTRVADLQMLGVLVDLEVAAGGCLVLAAVARELDLLMDGPLVEVQAAHLEGNRRNQINAAEHFGVLTGNNLCH
jgi:hypothetical protein